MEKKLALSEEKIARARELAERIVRPVGEFVDAHTTVTVERATLRLAGADLADADGVPVPNLVVDQLKGRLENGALLPYVNALVRTGETVDGLNRRIAGGFSIAELPLGDRAMLEARAQELVQAFAERAKKNRGHREAKLKQFAL